jgi:hypothetical protein
VSQLPKKRVIHEVRGILAEADIDVEATQQGHGYRVPIGSAVVEIDFYDWVDGQTVVSLHADVLVNVDLRDNVRLLALERVNALNHISKFGKFYVDEARGAVVLEHDLLGSELDASELLNALRTVGDHADRSDDELRELLRSGDRAADVPLSARAAVGDDEPTLGS